MDTKDVIIDNGRQGEVVKNFGAVPPHIHAAILPQAFVVEAVDLTNLCVCVYVVSKSISTQEKESQKEK